MRRTPATMSKVERAKFLLVQGAEDDQDFLDIGLAPEEGRALQRQILEDEERRVQQQTPSTVFAHLVLRTEEGIQQLADIQEKLYKQRQYQVAIGAVKAAHKMRIDLIKTGQELGVVKRAAGSGTQVNLALIGDSALRSVVGEKLSKVQRLLGQISTPLEDFDLPALGEKAPDMLGQERLPASRTVVLDEESNPERKRILADEPFPGD